MPSHQHQYRLPLLHYPHQCESSRHLRPHQVIFCIENEKKRLLLNDESDVGELKNIKDLEIDGDGKIVLKLVLGEEVNEDSERRIKISFSINGKEYEKIVNLHLIFH